MSNSRLPSERSTSLVVTPLWQRVAWIGTHDDIREITITVYDREVGRFETTSLKVNYGMIQLCRGRRLEGSHGSNAPLQALTKETRMSAAVVAAAFGAVAPSLSGRDIPTLDSLYEAAGGLNFTPGWMPRKKPILWAEPRSVFVPAHWTYENAKAALDAAGRLIDVSLAERRNLVMRNPAPGTNFETSRTLVCAYQMILPGESAPSHRHSSHALRVIIDGRGSYSIVNGQKIPMETGDVVLTPGWCWHGHGHEGDRPAYWFDGLDVPLTHLLSGLRKRCPGAPWGYITSRQGAHRKAGAATVGGPAGQDWVNGLRDAPRVCVGYTSSTHLADPSAVDSRAAVGGSASRQTKMT
jgi:hypothetical protein